MDLAMTTDNRQRSSRRIVANHEGGHALVVAVLPDVDPLYKVSIVPRGRALGVTQFLPEDERRNYPRS